MYCLPSGVMLLESLLGCMWWLECILPLKIHVSTPSRTMIVTKTFLTCGHQLQQALPRCEANLYLHAPFLKKICPPSNLKSLP